MNGQKILQANLQTRFRLVEIYENEKREWMEILMEIRPDSKFQAIFLADMKRDLRAALGYGTYSYSCPVTIKGCQRSIKYYSELLEKRYKHQKNADMDEADTDTYCDRTGRLQVNLWDIEILLEYLQSA